jgi:hypothetical protein
MNYNDGMYFFSRAQQKPVVELSQSLFVLEEDLWTKLSNLANEVGCGASYSFGGI